jgi:hypothetical protein
MLVIHFIACAWIFIGKWNIDEPDNWIIMNEFLDMSQHQLYAIGLYWSVTTITTVGYGDIHAQNTTEHIYSILVMIIGVYIYSSMIGIISNLIQNFDTRKANLNRKLEVL